VKQNAGSGQENAKPAVTEAYQVELDAWTGFKPAHSGAAAIAAKKMKD
jgi:hypothetical protein